MGRPCGFCFKDSRGTTTALVIYLRQTHCVVPGCHCASRFTNAAPYVSMCGMLTVASIPLNFMSIVEGGGGGGTGRKNLTYFLKASRIHNGRGGAMGDMQWTKPTS
jgi:hypothetical protein